MKLGKGSARKNCVETSLATLGSDEIPERTEHRSWSIARFADEISFWIARYFESALEIVRTGISSKARNPVYFFGGPEKNREKLQQSFAAK